MWQVIAVVAALAIFPVCAGAAWFAACVVVAWWKALGRSIDESMKQLRS